MRPPKRLFIISRPLPDELRRNDYAMYNMGISAMDKMAISTQAAGGHTGMGQCVPVIASSVASLRKIRARHTVRELPLQPHAIFADIGFEELALAFDAFSSPAICQATARPSEAVTACLILRHARRKMISSLLDAAIA